MYGYLAFYETMASGDILCQLKSLVWKLNATEEKIWMCAITFRLIRFSYNVVNAWYCIDILWYGCIFSNYITGQIE